MMSQIVCSTGLPADELRARGRDGRFLTGLNDAATLFFGPAMQRRSIRGDWRELKAEHFPT